MSMEQGTVNRFKPSLGNKTDRTSLENQVRVTKETYRFLACETGCLEYVGKLYLQARVTF